MFCKYLIEGNRNETKKGPVSLRIKTPAQFSYTYKSLVLFLNAKMCGAVNRGGGGRLYWVIGGRCDWERPLISESRKKEETNQSISITTDPL
jgi:hypothetical protein